MLVRVIVALFHAFIAAGLMIQALAWVAQGRVNIEWEAGFYGQIAPGSFAMLGAGVILFGLGAVEVALASSFAIGWKWAAQAMIAMSALLVFGTPWPVNMLMSLSVMAGWMQLRALAPIVEETEEEGD